MSLYVVTNNGKDVESAKSLVDAIILKLGISPVIDYLNILLAELLNAISSYAVFISIKEILDNIVDQLELYIKKLDPVLAFSIFKR